MKDFFYNQIVWMKNHKLQSWVTCIVILFLLIGSMYFMNISKEILTMKEEVFIVNVNEEVSQDATLYYDGIKEVDKVVYDFSNVDYKELGEYEGKIIYKEEEYVIKFKVVDNKAPVITINAINFSFPLDTTIEEVNDSVNKEITVSDNYDKEFDPLIIVDSIPEIEQELSVKISVKDTSGNESDTYEISIQFTEDGNKKEGLQKEEKNAESKNSNTNKIPPKSTPSNDSPSNDDPSSNDSPSKDEPSSNGDVIEKPSPTPPQEPDPVPIPEPEPPEPTPLPKPDPDPKPDYVCATGVIDKMKPCDYYEFTPSPLAIEWKIFNSDAEINAYYIDLDDSKFKIMRGSVRVNDGSFLYSAQIIAR